MLVIGLATKPVKKGPMNPEKEITLSQSVGVIGNYNKPLTANIDRQVTVLSWNQWREACREIGFPTHFPSWTLRRANICIIGRGFYPQDAGRIICLENSEIKLLITGEAKPCSRMDEVHPGLRAALSKQWRGGVTCRVLRGGKVYVGSRCRIIA